MFWYISRHHHSLSSSSSIARFPTPTSSPSSGVDDAYASDSQTQDQEVGLIPELPTRQQDFPNRSHRTTLSPPSESSLMHTQARLEHSDLNSSDVVRETDDVNNIPAASPNKPQANAAKNESTGASLKDSSVRTTRLFARLQLSTAVSSFLMYVFVLFSSHLHYD
jgi:hypothetical protein